MFVLSGQGTAEVFELVIVLAALGPFIGPAESALVPTLVARASLTSANAFLNFMRYVAQVAGLAIPAPVLTRTAGVETLFLVTGIFFGAPGGDRGGAGVPAGAGDVWQAAIQNSLISATLPLLAALIPVYLVEMLDQRVSDLPVIFLPGIVGMMLGLWLVGSITRRREAGGLATAGMWLFAAGLLALALVDVIEGGIGALAGYEDGDLGLFGDVDLGVIVISAKSLVAMALLFPMRFAFSLVNVATTAIISERVPISMQGRVFALMMLMTGIAALPRLLAGGGLTEVADVRVVLGLSPLLLLGAWSWAQWGSGRGGSGRGGSGHVRSGPGRAA